MTEKDRPEIFAHRRYIHMHIAAQLRLDLPEFAFELLPGGLTLDSKTTVLSFPTVVGKAEEGERLRFALSAFAATVRCIGNRSSLHDLNPSPVGLSDLAYLVV